MNTKKKVIVVGSGAGGAMVARELSRSFKVTVLEAGRDFAPFAWNLSKMEPLRKVGLFFDERMIQLLFPQMRILKSGNLVHVYGECVGGTTALATGNAYRSDDHLKDIGINLDAEFEELRAEVPQITTHQDRWSKATRDLFQVFKEKGFELQVTPKFMTDSKRCALCGKCVLGCKTGAKWTSSMLLEGLEDVELIKNCKVLRLMSDSSGKTCGVVAKKSHGKGVFYEADVVVLSAGGLNTPEVLARSGIKTKPTLFVDPVLCVAAKMPGIKMDRQLPMPFIAQREGYILSPYFDWLSLYFNKQWRSDSGDIASVMIKLADESVGSYSSGKLDKSLTQRDAETLQRGVTESKSILEAFGAKKEALLLGTVNAGHPGGCLPLTQDEAESLHSGVLPENVYVADASLLPYAKGHPPILTIMALSKRIARLIESKFA